MSEEAGGTPRDGTPRSELWWYVFAAVTYIAAGFPVKQVFAWWWFGAMWLILVVWVGPKILDRFRRDRAVDSPEDEPASGAPA